MPLPVAHVARNMGLSRQSVQRVVDLLAERDMVRYKANPHHQRAKLVELTAAGRAVLDAADAAEEALSRALLNQIGAERIDAAIGVLTEMNELMARSDHNMIANGEESVA